MKANAPYIDIHNDLSSLLKDDWPLLFTQLLDSYYLHSNLTLTIHGYYSWIGYWHYLLYNFFTKNKIDFGQMADILFSSLFNGLYFLHVADNNYD